MDIEKIVREYIDKSLHMSLATSNNNHPWVSEVHFTYDDNLNIYWRSQKTRRHSQEIISNPSVAGNIVQQHTIDDYPHAIYFEGTAELVDDESQYQKLCDLFLKRGIGNESMADDAKLETGHKFYKVTAKNWYAFGKFGGSSGQKFELKWNGGKK